MFGSDGGEKEIESKSVFGLLMEEKVKTGQFAGVTVYNINPTISGATHSPQCPAVLIVLVRFQYSITG